MNGFKYKWWIIPVLLGGFVFILSLRQLSDPDLGFHLRYGKWISDHHQVPERDQTTFTVADHSYIDLHWLFQWGMYQLYKSGGYPALSVWVASLAMIMLLVMRRLLKITGVSPPILYPVLLMFFLVIEPRIATRPELISFILLTSVLVILELFIRRKKNLLFLLPVILILWCNVHALFILGLIVISVYVLSDTISNRKISKLPGIALLASVAVCFFNPYGWKGVIFPFELLTRFQEGNIFHQHIREFMPLSAKVHWFAGDFLFAGFTFLTIMVMGLRHRNLRAHEIILTILFGTGAWMAIRNIPLAMIVMLPYTASHLSGYLKEFVIRDHSRQEWYFRWIPAIRKSAATISAVLTLLIISLILPRLLTGAWYRDTGSPNRTGTGLNAHIQPVGAAAFIRENHLEGKILNSLGYGGWLSWLADHPIFIDGRLEVMEERIYRKLTQSWNGGLASMAEEYGIEVICYDYIRYYPWTGQLAAMPDWRLVYADGLAAVFTRTGYREDLPTRTITVDPHRIAVWKSAQDLPWWIGFYQPIYSPFHDSLRMAILAEHYRPRRDNARSHELATRLFNEANDCMKRGDVRCAFSGYNRVIGLDPAYTKAYNNRAILRATRMHDLKGALEDFNQAISIDPEYSDAYIGRGSIYFELHEPEKARQDWRAAASLGNSQATKLIGSHFTDK